LAIIFIRTVILYFAILVSMRVMGKRQLGELEISEFIVAALIAVKRTIADYDNVLPRNYNCRA